MYFLVTIKNDPYDKVQAINGEIFMYKFGLILMMTSLSVLADNNDDMRSRAKKENIDTLCMVQILRPELAQIASDEILSRKAKCDWDRTKLQTEVYLKQQQQQQVQKQQETNLAEQQSAAAQQAQQLESQRAMEASDRQRQFEIQQQQLAIQERQAKDAASSQALQNLNQAIQNMGPRTIGPAPNFPRQTNCRTVYYVGGAQTQCQ